MPMGFWRHNQDPRYFRVPAADGQGSDRRSVRASGHSPIPAACNLTTPRSLGYSAAVAVSSAYYADTRTAGIAVGKLGVQIHEFWPDLERKLHRHGK
jgi:hypothetical protein